MAERAIDGLVDSGIRAVFAHGTAKPPTAARAQAVHPHPASARAHRSAAQGPAGGRRRPRHARDGDPRSRLGHLGGGRARHPHGARVRPGVVVAYPAARGLRRARRLRTAWPRRDCSGPTTISCTAPATTQADLQVIVDSGASLTSTVLVELHHHIGDTQVAAFRAAGGLPSLGIDVEPLLHRADVPRDAGGAAVRARQGNPQQRAARQLAVQAACRCARARRWNGRRSAARAPS